MQVIELTYPYAQEQIIEQDIVLALGFFDGLHRGHQKLIETAKHIAKQQGYLLAVMSFHQHPSVVLQNLPEQEVTYLSSLERKTALLEQMGVDVFYVVEFTREFSSLLPQQFVDEFIVGLHAKVVVAGFDYTYGKPSIASMKQLHQYAKERFAIVCIPEQKENDEKISSTAIREALLNGNMQQANHLLGYAYQTQGTVVHGYKRGSKLLGYPTANVEVADAILLPKVGVYAVRMLVHQQWYQGMASIGYNPTFGGEEHPVVEVNVFDFDEEIYEEEVVVEWRHYLRDEMKFDTVEALVVQLGEDKEQTLAFFEGENDDDAY